MNPSIFSLKDKVFLVSGGYGHLGKSMALGILEAGASVWVLGRDPEKFRQAFQDGEILENLHFMEYDLSDNESIKHAFKAISDKEGHIDGLVNNAFFSRGKGQDNMPDEDWNYGVDGTLNSVYRAIREIIPYLRANKGGKIINISSMYGVVSPDFSMYEGCEEFTNPPHYGAAKAGVIQLTKYYAVYLGKDGVNVNCITPGPFPKPKVQENSMFIERLKQKNPLGRFGEPDDLKGAVVFLSSPASDYITGQNLMVDGGWTVW